MSKIGTPERLSFSGEYCVSTASDYYFLQHPSVAKRKPLLVFLHGLRQEDRLFELDAPPKMAVEGRLPISVLSPVSSDDRWNIDDVLGLVSCVTKERSIDPDRIYATGISIGGLATWEMALRKPDLFAAIVPICGAGQPWNAFKISKLPTWAFHGALDDTVPVEESEAMVNNIKDDGGDARLTVYPDLGHRAWGRAYADPTLWSWLMSQKKK